jgi:hypothetical protein
MKMENNNADIFGLDPSKFLQYGSIGLAGLMLFLVVVAISLKDLTPSLERTLRNFMAVGAFCFVASLVATYLNNSGAHNLRFKVLPHDVDGENALPPPVIEVNGTPLLDRKIPYKNESDAMVIVDVNRALELVQRKAQELEKANSSLVQHQESFSRMLELSERASAQIQNIPKIIANNCPGGSNGVSAISNTAVLDIAKSAISDLGQIEAMAFSGSSRLP